MFALPLYLFLALYIILVLVSIIFFLFDLYHVIAAGEFSLTTFVFTGIVGGVIVLILAATSLSLYEYKVNWSDSLPIFNSSWVAAPDNF